MEKGIILILNNFDQISHELFVTMRTLSTLHQINHNQKTIHSKSGFKIIGICTNESKKKSKNLQSSLSIVPHFSQPSRIIENLIPFDLITIEINKQFISESVHRLISYGYSAQKKLWKRIMRLRQKAVNYDLS